MAVRLLGYAGLAERVVTADTLAEVFAR